MKNVLLILVTLALVSVAHAGPFGFKRGMTVKEIIKAGYKSDYGKIKKISKSEYIDKYLFKLENYKNNQSPFSKRSSIRSKVIHADHPNKVFVIRINKNNGLDKLEVKIPVKDKASVDFITDKYTKQIHSKYGGNIKVNKEYSEGDFLIQSASLYRDIYLETPLDQKEQVEMIFIHRWSSKELDTYFLKIDYLFMDPPSELEKKLKELLPKEEDL